MKMRRLCIDTSSPAYQAPTHDREPRTPLMSSVNVVHPFRVNVVVP